MRVPWTARRSNQSILKEISPGCSLEGLDAEAETPILWPPHAKSWLIGKDSDVGRDWGQEEKGTTQDEMAGWHHWLDGREFEWTPGVGDGQGGLACCDLWVTKSQTRLSDWTELKEADINTQVQTELLKLKLVSYGQRNECLGSFHIFILLQEMEKSFLSKDLWSWGVLSSFQISCG